MSDGGLLRPRVLWLLIILAAALSQRAPGQARYLQRYQEPQWLTLHISDVSAGMYAEGTFDQTDYKNSNENIRHENIFIGPTLGFHASGSVYHPNLFVYTVNADGAYGWDHDDFSNGSPVNGFNYIGSFSAGGTLFPDRPYRANLFGNYDHTLRENDFFTQVTVDSWRYGVGLSYDSGPWIVHVDASHHDEAQTGLNIDSTTHENVAGLLVRNERANGGTVFNYNFDQYTRVDSGGTGEGTDNSLGLNDSEHFGNRDQYKLHSNANYFLRDASDDKSDEVTADVNFSAEHTPKLSSFYDLNYDWFKDDTSDFNSQTFGGNAALQHQLYDSLTSSLLVRGSDYDSSNLGGSGYVRRYGGGFGESYIKKTSDTSQLRIDNTLFIEHTDQKNQGDVENERHTFGEAGAPPDSFFLNQIDVITSTIVVNNQNDQPPPYVLNIDYVIIPNGSRTLIQRVIGSQIPPGATVLVDYQSVPTPPGSYETLTESFQIRYELWKDLMGIYTRINLSLNNAPADLRIQEVQAYAFGVDFRRGEARAGAEYEIYNSTESDYRAARLYQSIGFHPDAASSLTFDASEAWINYVNANNNEQDYRFITRYHRSLTYNLGLDADAGIAFRIGGGVDQTLATARCAIKYVIGRTSIDAGYNYEYELFLDNEERQRNLFTLRYKRSF